MMKIYLEGENISMGGSVEYLKCSSCRFQSFRLLLSADTDMVYQGIVGFTSVEKKELVLNRMTTDEYNQYDKLTGKQLSERMNRLLNRSDLEYYKSRHFIKEDKKIFWATICPKCEGYFIIQKRIDFNQFMKDGGKIISVSESDEINIYK